ncbi:MAG TPA: ribulose-phosphate 3-epimerase [bacterium]|nr:MAG: Ribulose-phosphate 3-epimerase [bacterium ADurb.Bin270]HPW44845.1 ribulose-phosphate 3-epimerase [bacterium]HQC50519.1 ribulose-phosphate 3-epimerase [bacterium]HQH79814.1 ribulose-phosphate 3-epimerase [bacterium]
MKTMIAPSILSADFAKLGEEISAVERAGADVIHIDVMDGHFVPNITIGPLVVKGIRKTTRLPLDCHLMIEEPEKYIAAFAKAGADWISVHVETSDLRNLLPDIRKLECKAGIVINPPTPVEKIFPYLELADFVLIMTVNPGFGGQKMIYDSVEKISIIKKRLKEMGASIPVEVDGGVNSNTVNRVLSAGADIIVAGSAIFESNDYAKSIASLR